MNRGEIQFLSCQLLTAIGLTTLFFIASFPLRAQQAAQGPACSEAALKAYFSDRWTSSARPGHVETILFKTFEVSPARSAEGKNACAVHTVFTHRTASATAIYERDREEHYLCSPFGDGDYLCPHTQTGRNVGERRDIWHRSDAATPTEEAQSNANVSAAPQPPAQPASIPAPAIPAPAKPVSGCSSEAAFRYVISDTYEGIGSRVTRVFFKKFEVGAPTRYTDPYHRAVNTKAYPVKAEFTVRQYHSDADEENDHAANYLCYQDTHGECVCTMQTGGSLGQTRYIPK